LSKSENKSLIKVAIDILDKDQTADIYREVKSRMKQRQESLTNFKLYLTALLEICYQLESVIHAALQIGMKFPAKGDKVDKPFGGKQNKVHPGSLCSPIYLFFDRYRFFFNRYRVYIGKFDV
jgi:hypothetical protein